MADEIVVQFLRDGVSGLVRSSQSLFGMTFTGFQVGDAIGFTPSPDETGPRGNITYVGNRSGIKVKSLDEGASTRVTGVVPEDTDNVNVGNVVFYTNTAQGIKPAIIMVLPTLVRKQNVSSAIVDAGFQYPSTRMEISITLKYVDQGDFDIEIVITPVIPEYSNLPFFASDTDVPEPDSNPWQQFIVNRMEIWGGGPALVTKDADGFYYASPLSQDVTHPKFGVIGGNEFDPGLRIRWIWGGRYDTPNELYTGSYNGGATYEDDIPLDAIRGGDTY